MKADQELATGASLLQQPALAQSHCNHCDLQCILPLTGSWQVVKAACCCSLTLANPSMTSRAQERREEELLSGDPSVISNTQLSRTMSPIV